MFWNDESKIMTTTTIMFKVGRNNNLRYFNSVKWQVPSSQPTNHPSIRLEVQTSFSSKKVVLDILSFADDRKKDFFNFFRPPVLWMLGTCECDVYISIQIRRWVTPLSIFLCVCVCVGNISEEHTQRSKQITLYLSAWTTGSCSNALETPSLSLSLFLTQHISLHHIHTHTFIFVWITPSLSLSLARISLKSLYLSFSFFLIKTKSYIRTPILLQYTNTQKHGTYLPRYSQLGNVPTQAYTPSLPYFITPSVIYVRQTDR